MLNVINEFIEDDFKLKLNIDWNIHKNNTVLVYSFHLKSWSGKSKFKINNVSTISFYTFSLTFGIIYETYILSKSKVIKG